MPFDFSKYKTVATELSQNPTEENIRAAISRAYYCLYHRAEKLVKQRDLGTPYSGGSHEKIINAIKENNEINSNVLIAKNLSDLKQNRVYSDYDSSPPRPIVFNDRYFRSFWNKYKRTNELIDQAHQG